MKQICINKSQLSSCFQEKDRILCFVFVETLKMQLLYALGNHLQYLCSTHTDATLEKKFQNDGKFSL